MCKEEDMADFPRRMRDWLFNIMRDLADRQELSSHYLKMQREAETNHTLRWTNAAIWKWCDLDGHPHDRTVSRHELFPIKAPLMALEHCIAPFLDSCDINNDHKITLVEWGKCLQLDEVSLPFSYFFWEWFFLRNINRILLLYYTHDDFPNLLHTILVIHFNKYINIINPQLHR